MNIQNGFRLHDLEILSKASIPVVAINTFEEMRVLDDIYNTSLSLNKDTVKVWKRTTGLIDYPYHKETIHESTMFIGDVLNELLRSTPTEKSHKAFYILLDIHPYIEDEAVIRFLKDIAQQWALTKKTLVLISPNLQIPEELSKLISVIEYKIPDKQFIEEEIIPKYVNEMVKSGLGKTPEEVEKNPPSKPYVKLFDIHSEEGDDMSILADVVTGLTKDEIDKNFRIVTVRNAKFNKDVARELLEEKKQIVKKSGLLEFLEVNDTEVGGLKNLIEWAEHRGLAFSKKAREYGLPYPKGVFLMGVPGTGKTLFAKTMGKLWNMPVLKWDVSKMFASLQGQTESNVAMALQVAEACSPNILLIDECEKLFSGTGSSNMTDGGTGDRVMGQVLNWLQEKTAPVFVVATANSIKSLPPEFMRRGRFDELFFVGLPDAVERKEILEIHLRNKDIKLSKREILDVVDRTKTFTGAEIESTVTDSMFIAFSDNARPVEGKDLIEASKHVKPIYLSQKEVVENMLQWANERARIANSWEGKVQTEADMRKVVEAIAPALEID